MSEYQVEQDPTEIVGWYVPSLLSGGHEPTYLKEEFLGIAFPVRRANSIHASQYLTYDENVPEINLYNPDEVVTVSAADAVRALVLAGKPTPAFSLTLRHSSFGADINEAFIVFERKKGYLLSLLEMGRMFPEMPEFDEALPS